MNEGISLNSSIEVGQCLGENETWRLLYILSTIFVLFCFIISIVILLLINNYIIGIWNFISVRPPLIGQSISQLLNATFFVFIIGSIFFGIWISLILISGVSHPFVVPRPYRWLGLVVIGIWLLIGFWLRLVVFFPFMKPFLYFTSEYFRFTCDVDPYCCYQRIYLVSISEIRFVSNFHVEQNYFIIPLIVPSFVDHGYRSIILSRRRLIFVTSDVSEYTRKTTWPPRLRFIF